MLEGFKSLRKRWTKLLQGQLKRLKPVYDARRMNILEASHDLVDDKFHLIGGKVHKVAIISCFHVFTHYVQADTRTEGLTEPLFIFNESKLTVRQLFLLLIVLKDLLPSKAGLPTWSSVSFCTLMMLFRSRSIRGETR